jgi:hypothetical protein
VRDKQAWTEWVRAKFKDIREVRELDRDRDDDCAQGSRMADAPLGRVVPPRQRYGHSEVTMTSGAGEILAQATFGEPMPRLATERAWYTPLLIVAGVLVLMAVYTVLLWVVVAGPPA